MTFFRYARIIRGVRLFTYKFGHNKQVYYKIIVDIEVMQCYNVNV